MTHDSTTFDKYAHKVAAADVFAERIRAHLKFGEVNLPDGTGTPFDLILLNEVRRGVAAAGGHKSFRSVLEEEVLEAFAESDIVRLRAELVQVASTAMQWVEKLDRESKVEEKMSAIALRVVL